MGDRSGFLTEEEVGLLPFGEDRNIEWNSSAKKWQWKSKVKQTAKAMEPPNLGNGALSLLSLINTRTSAGTENRTFADSLVGRDDSRFDEGQFIGVREGLPPDIDKQHPLSGLLGSVIDDHNRKLAVKQRDELLNSIHSSELTKLGGKQLKNKQGILDIFGFGD